MAKNSLPNQGHYEPGTMINTSAAQLEATTRRRERNGQAQVLRVLAGLEAPAANVKEDRERAVAALQALPLNVVGVPTPDIHARDKVTGRARYSADLFRAGMLHVRVLRSPHPNARIRSIDVSRARALPGVVDLLTFEDIAEFARAAVSGEAAAAGGVSKPELDGAPPYAGAGVAAVAAETPAIAEDALGLIQVDYELLPFVLDAREALRAGAPRVNAATQSNAAFDPQFSSGRGDAAQGFREADVVVEVHTTSSFEQHNSMEPHVAVVEWNTANSMTIWSSTQWPHGMRDAIAQVFRMPQSQIRVLAEHTGGGWGDKTGKHPYHIYTALLAQRTGRPVRYEARRKDSFYEQGHNFPKEADARMGFRRDGAITALQGESWIPVGGYNEALGNSDDWESALRLYKIANVDVKGNSALTNTVITSPLRCVGEPGGIFTLEILMDAAAEQLNMDPLALRLQNIEEEIDQVIGLPYSSNGIRETLERGAAAFGWTERWKGWQPNNVRVGDDPVRGVGMAAFVCNKGAAILARTANVHMNGDGSVSVYTGAADIGGGQATAWSMIAAEALGVPLERVRIYRMDTSAGPDSSGIFGSRGTKTVGMAVLQAALDAKKQLLDGAAFTLSNPGLLDPRIAAFLGIPVGGPPLQVTADDLDFVNGLIVVKADPSIRLPAVAVVGVGGSIIGSARLAPFIPGYSQKTFGAGFYEVEVDPGTGFVRVTDVVQVHDVGKVINPQAIENQVHGGIMQGINKALSEELVYDPPTGLLVNPNLDEYKLHMIDAVPDRVQALFVEPIDVAGPFGAKGIGEPALALAMPAIANAIYNAIGVRLSHVPMTPPRVINGLMAKV